MSKQEKVNAMGSDVAARARAAFSPPDLEAGLQELEAVRRAAAWAARGLGAGWVDWEDVASDVLLRRLERGAVGGAAAPQAGLRLEVLRRASVLARRERRRREGWERAGCTTLRRTAESVDPGRDDERIVGREEAERARRRLRGCASEVQEAVGVLGGTRSAQESARLLGVPESVVWARARRGLAQEAATEAGACTFDSPPPPGPLRDSWLLALSARGYAAAELALRLGQTVQAVRMRLSRAHRRIRAGPVTPPSGS